MEPVRGPLQRVDNSGIEDGLPHFPRRTREKWGIFRCGNKRKRLLERFHGGGFVVLHIEDGI